jgi:hypothetical protein
VPAFGPARRVCRLVKDKQLRIDAERLGDLDKLALGDAEARNHRVGRDIGAHAVE